MSAKKTPSRLVVPQPAAHAKSLPASHMISSLSRATQTHTSSTLRTSPSLACYHPFSATDGGGGRQPRVKHGTTDRHLTGRQTRTTRPGYAAQHSHTVVHTCTCREVASQIPPAQARLCTLHPSRKSHSSPPSSKTARKASPSAISSTSRWGGGTHMAPTVRFIIAAYRACVSGCEGPRLHRGM